MFIGHGFILCQMTPLEPPFPLSWTLTIGWKNKKQLFGPIELDIEAGNLVLLQKRFQHFKLFDCLRCEFIMPTDHPPSVVVLQFLS